MACSTPLPPPEEEKAERIVGLMRLGLLLKPQAAEVEADWVVGGLGERTSRAAADWSGEVEELCFWARCASLHMTWGSSSAERGIPSSSGPKLTSEQYPSDEVTTSVCPLFDLASGHKV